MDLVFFVLTQQRAALLEKSDLRALPLRVGFLNSAKCHGTQLFEFDFFRIMIKFSTLLTSDNSECLGSILGFFFDFLRHRVSSCLRHLIFGRMNDFLFLIVYIRKELFLSHSQKPCRNDGQNA